VAAYRGVAIQYVVRTAGGDEMTVIEQNRDGASVGPGRDVLLAWRPEHTFVVDKENDHAA
jgi:spermidine/putrescine transport system ATP-binding protein